MDTAILRNRLTEANDYEGWLTALADCFAEAGLFFGHGTDNAGDEAFWLIRHLQAWSEDGWKQPPAVELIEPAVALARRRVEERIPLAYLLGEAWFAGLPFFVSRDVLIPRSPLAELLERRFAPWAEVGPGDRVLEVGTGSGCIAIAAAHFCPEIDVDATDVSAEALAVASQNVQRHGLGQRVHLYNEDLFPDVDHAYRVIISNPPYVPDAELADLPPEYQVEPALALAGGDAGIEPAERLLRGARERLISGGVLIVEVGAQAESFMARHPRLPAVWLEFERGGEGVFVLTVEQLDDYFSERQGGCRHGGR